MLLAEFNRGDEARNILLAEIGAEESEWPSLAEVRGFDDYRSYISLEDEKEVLLTRTTCLNQVMKRV